jgi:hypothetical protein
VSLTVWDGDEGPRPDPPRWMLTGHMLLWNDGSPAHVDMEPFTATDEGWEAQLMISRSARIGTRWLTLRMTMTVDVRREWQTQGTSPRARALQSLANYVRLTEWYGDDLGVLELK